MFGNDAFPVVMLGTIITNRALMDRVLYRHIEISEQGGTVRRLTIVGAVEELALLVEKHAIGLFLLWEREAERRLWCVDRADGPKQVDFEAIRAYVQQHRNFP
jgi:hypothetical protein